MIFKMLQRRRLLPIGKNISVAGSPNTLEAGSVMDYQIKKNGWYFNPKRESNKWNGVGPRPIWFNELLANGLNPDDYFTPDTPEDKQFKDELESHLRQVAPRKS